MEPRSDGKGSRGTLRLRERLLGAVQGLSSADLRGPATHREADVVLLADMGRQPSLVRRRRGCPVRACRAVKSVRLRWADASRR